MKLTCFENIQLQANDSENDVVFSSLLQDLREVLKNLIDLQARDVDGRVQGMVCSSRGW